MFQHWFFSFFNLTNKLLLSINHSFIYSIIRTHAYVHFFANSAKYVDAGSNTTPSSIIKRSTQNNIYNGIYPLGTFLQTNKNDRIFLILKKKMMLLWWRCILLETNYCDVHIFETNENWIVLFKYRIIFTLIKIHYYWFSKKFQMGRHVLLSSG